MNKKEMIKLYDTMFFEISNNMKFDMISALLKSSNEIYVKEGKNLIISKVKTIAPKYLDYIEYDELVKFSKYLNRHKINSLESVCPIHKNQKNNNYTVDLLEIAICKYVSIYADEKKEQNAEIPNKN